jgi:hypothetical protein
MRHKQTAPQRKRVQQQQQDDDVELLDAEQGPEQATQQAQHAQQLHDWQLADVQLQQQPPRFYKRLEINLPNVSSSQQQQKYASVGAIAEFVVATKAGGSPPAGAAPATVQVQAHSRYVDSDYHHLSLLLLFSWRCPSEGESGPKHEVCSPLRVCPVGKTWQLGSLDR